MKSTAKIPRFWLLKPVLLLLAVAAVTIFSFFHAAVERYYSTGLYPGMARVLRIVNGRLPFSVGDLVYGIGMVWLVIKLLLAIKNLAQSSKSGTSWLYFVIRILSGGLALYLIFKLIWGLNYNRLGIAHQLRLTRSPYTKEEVTLLTNRLIDSLNACRKQWTDTLLPALETDSIFQTSHRAYQIVEKQYPFLQYQHLSVKKSEYTFLADYIGFTGYYNPFTGEAQLRTDVPRILLPAVTCHEMAHQLGYASESEANFVGYLAASRSNDPYFRYSIYLDLFSYAQGEQITLYAQEKDFANFEAVIASNRNRLDTLVKMDRKLIREFFTKRKSQITPAFTGLYDQYLKMNQQQEGMKSYDAVIGWLIAYLRNNPL